NPMATRQRQHNTISYQSHQIHITKRPRVTSGMAAQQRNSLHPRLPKPPSKPHELILYHTPHPPLVSSRLRKNLLSFISYLLSYPARWSNYRAKLTKPYGLNPQASGLCNYSPVVLRPGGLNGYGLVRSNNFSRPALDC